MQCLRLTSQLLFGNVYHSSQRRGRESEKNVAAALNSLRRDGIVHSYLQAKPNDELDRSHIDFLITTSSGKHIPLQVKSSPQKVQAHAQKHPQIPVVHGQMSKDDIIVVLLKIFETWQPS